MNSTLLISLMIALSSKVFLKRWLTMITTVKVKDLCRAYRHEAYLNFHIFYLVVATCDDRYGKMNCDANTIVLANGLFLS